MRLGADPRTEEEAWRSTPQQAALVSSNFVVQLTHSPSGFASFGYASGANPRFRVSLKAVLMKLTS